MLVRYTSNYQDFVAAQRLGILRKPYGRLRYISFRWILPILGGLCLLALLYDIAIRHFVFKPATGGILAAVAWLGLWTAAYRPFQYRSLYRQMKNGRPDSKQIEIELSGNEIISRVPGVSEGRFLRGAIHDYAEDEHVLLLYVGKRLFLLVPKRTIAEPEIAAIRDWLRTTEA